VSCRTDDFIDVARVARQEALRLSYIGSVKMTSGTKDAMYSRLGRLSVHELAMRCRIHRPGLTRAVGIWRLERPTSRTRRFAGKWACFRIEPTNRKQDEPLSCTCQARMGDTSPLGKHRLVGYVPKHVFDHSGLGLQKRISFSASPHAGASQSVVMTPG
jgi:hypothetical protein